MDWVNFGWHAGAVAFGFWAAWLIHELRSERRELLEGALPCVLAGGRNVSRSRFLRACHSLLETGVGSRLRGRLRVSWPVHKDGGGSARLSGDESRRALSALYELGWVSKPTRSQTSGAADGGEESHVFVFDGGSSAELLTAEELGTRLFQGARARDWDFEYLGPTPSDRGTLYWRVRQA